MTLKKVNFKGQGHEVKMSPGCLKRRDSMTGRDAGRDAGTVATLY